jgi:hypothetical protein
VRSIIELAAGLLNVFEVFRCPDPCAAKCRGSGRDAGRYQIRLETAFDGGLEARGAIAMSQKTDAIANTIGIDTGKNTLHLIGLDHEGTIVLREKLGRGRIVARMAKIG